MEIICSRVALVSPSIEFSQKIPPALKVKPFTLSAGGPRQVRASGPCTDASPSLHERNAAQVFGKYTSIAKAFPNQQLGYIICAHRWAQPCIALWGPPAPLTAPSPTPGLTNPAANCGRSRQKKGMGAHTVHCLQRCSPLNTCPTTGPPLSTKTLQPLRTAGEHCLSEMSLAEMALTRCHLETTAMSPSQIRPKSRGLWAP